MTARHSSQFFIAMIAGILLAGCASQERRTERVEDRQDGIDRRTEGRLERRQIRGDREDARTEARMNSW